MFDFSNWDRYKYHYIVILVIIILLVIIVYQRQEDELKDDENRDGNGSLYRMGRGSEDDDIGELLDRIEWSTYLEQRTSTHERYFLTTVIVVILIILLLYRKLPHPGEIVLLFILVFIPFYALFNFFFVHGDMYNSYYIKNNVEILRGKLDVKKGSIKEPSDDNIPYRTEAIY